MMIFKLRGGIGVEKVLAGKEYLFPLCSCVEKHREPLNIF
jgi:hypothetical protein